MLYVLDEGDLQLEARFTFDPDDLSELSYGYILVRLDSEEGVEQCDHRKKSDDAKHSF